MRKNSAQFGQPMNFKRVDVSENRKRGDHIDRGIRNRQAGDAMVEHRTNVHWHVLVEPTDVAAIDVAPPDVLDIRLGRKVSKHSAAGTAKVQHRVWVKLVFSCHLHDL